MTAGLPGLTIGRLVAHGRQDKLDLRLRLEAGLGLADLGARGLPPDAILCVRRLADPLPGHLPARGGVMPPDRWRSAVAQRLDNLARVAGRPAFGGVNDGAEAVLFASRAELLASLARDWLTHGRLDRWWWAHLALPGAPAAAVVSEWRTYPESVPGALEFLAVRRLATVFCDRLTSYDASDLMARVAGAHGIELPDPTRVRDRAVGRMPPWEPVVPEAAAGSMSPEAAMLAGVSLTLARRPALARTRGFAAAAVAWVQEQQNLSGSRRNDPQPPEWQGEHVASERPGSKPAVPDVRPPVSTTGEPGDLGALAEGRWALPDDPAEVAQTARPRVDESSDQYLATFADQSRSQPSVLDASGSQLTRAQVVTPPREDAAGFPPLTISEGVLRHSSFQTSHGGAFFLANVALAQELYADFTRPSERGLDMDFWAFVLMASCDLLGGLPDDPLWAFLRDLAGEGEPTPDPELTDWRIPPVWLDPVGAGTQWTYRVANGRLRVTHDLGFAIVDVPFAGEAADGAVRSMLDGYPPVPLVHGSREMTYDGSSSQGTAELVIPYIRVRLAQALAVPANDAGSLLIAHPALVEAGPESIRVTFALDRHPIAIRLAGLDRDPGWIPAAGRSITFAFDPARE